MRLEQKKDTRAPGVTRRAEHRGDFGRMMSVIVDHKKIRRSKKCFEAAAGSAEGFERFGADGKIESELGGECERGAGIDGVVFAGNIQGDAREFFVTAAESEHGTEVGGAEIAQGVMAGLAVGNGVGESGTDATRAFVICAVDDFARGLAEQLREGRINGGQIGIMVEVFGLDVEHDAVLRMVLHDGAITFVTLGDEKFAARIPACVGAEDGNLRADIMRWMSPGGAEDMRGHG